MEQTSRDGRFFPGGQVHLPRLNPDDRGPEPIVQVVDTAFLGGGTATLEAEPEPSGFTGYFTYESLFEPPEEPETVDGEDAYEVLRVKRSDDWQTIHAAHRALVKEFHPDRFAGQDPDLIATAEDEIRRINIAYGQIRKDRAEEAPERRSGSDRRANER